VYLLLPNDVILHRLMERFLEGTRKRKRFIQSTAEVDEGRWLRLVRPVRLVEIGNIREIDGVLADLNLPIVERDSP